jgi:hypothetical protein
MKSLNSSCKTDLFLKIFIFHLFLGNMVLSNGQFEVHENETSKSELILTLTIRNVTIRNMGKYECVAKNPFGASEANIRAYSKYLKGQYYKRQLSNVHRFVRKNEKNNCHCHHQSCFSKVRLIAYFSHLSV